MPTQVVLPKLDRLMTEGVVQRWLKREGEDVKKGEAMAVIETEKVTVELEAPESGIFFPRAGEGETIKVGSVIAYILGPGEKAPEPLAKASPVKLAEVQAPDIPKPEVPTERKEKVLATPAAKRLSKELGVELSEVKGTGPEESILAEDVTTYAEKVKGAAALPSLEVGPEKGVEEGEETIPLTGWRKVMAERMAESTRILAQITTVAEVDATELVNLRERLKPLEVEIQAKMTYTSLMIKAVGTCLKEFPIMNSSIVGGKIVLHKEINVGLAVAREEGGLVVPVIRNVDKKDLITIARELEEVSRKARENRLTLDDVTGGTFTVTNPGMMGVILDTPIISLPQSGILGIGAIVKRPWVVNDEITIRHIMYLSLTYDHRTIDGAPAIRFLQRVRQLMESPHTLLAGTIGKS